MIAGVRPVPRLETRIATKLDELGRAAVYGELRPHFPPTELGAQLAAYMTLADDLPDQTEAGSFARRDLLPALLAHPDETGEAARTALRALPRGDASYATKELLVNFVGGLEQLAPATRARILADFIAVEDVRSEAYSAAEARLLLLRK